MTQLLYLFQQHCDGSCFVCKHIRQDLDEGRAFLIMSIGEVTCKNQRIEFGEVFRVEGALGEGDFLKEKFRGQACWSWVMGGAAPASLGQLRPHTLYCGEDVEGIRIGWDGLGFALHDRSNLLSTHFFTGVSVL